MAETVYLVDGSGYIFRAYHALPPMTRPDGTPVNAVYGYCNMMQKLLTDVGAQRIVVVFDAGRTTFRNTLYPAYKAHRPDPPADLIPQFALIRAATTAYNIPWVEQEGFEADDLIATYADHAVAKGDNVVIVSSDKDLMQLVTPRITMLDPIKNKPITETDVLEKFGVPPSQVVEVQALTGDSIDNVPGVAGIGIKTAVQLLQEFGSLDALLANAHTIKQEKRRQTLLDNADNARISRELVTLKRDVPLATPLSALTPVTIDIPNLQAFLEANNFRSLLARVQKEPTKPVAKPAYELVTTEAALQKWVASIKDTGFMVFDTETTSLNALQAELVGIALATSATKACYIPLAHGKHEGFDFAGMNASLPRQLDKTLVITILKPLFADASIRKVAHNLKYDWHVLHNAGITEWASVDDTMVMSYVLDSSLNGHGMDELAKKHFDYDTITYAQVTGTGKAQISFAEVPLEQARDYAAEDAAITARLYDLFQQRLISEHMTTVYETLERPLIAVLATMERNGIRVDPTILAKLSQDFAASMATLEEDIFTQAGMRFNIGSPKQLGDVLFDHLKLDGGKRSKKSGAYGTGADVLEALATQGHGIAAKVLEWRQLAKLKSTYSDALVRQIHPRTGRVHTSFMQTVTSTGRLSSSDPNLQNIPIRSDLGRKIRGAFIADKGCQLISVDYSQIEMRLLAEMADIKTLKDAFRDGRDIHALTAHQVFGVPLESVSNDLRRRAKAINFGIIYGISAYGLSQQLGCPVHEADTYIKAYFVQYPGIKAYMEHTIAHARQHGYVTTLFGRKCYTTGIHDKNPNMRNFAERAAINAPLQGTAADLIKRAMIRVQQELVQQNLTTKLLLQVHDELILEAPSDEVERIKVLLSRLMPRAAEPRFHLSVPLEVDIGIGANWNDAH